MTDMDAVDHAAEHYAMTGSDVCWCDIECSATSDDPGARNARCSLPPGHPGKHWDMCGWEW